MICKTLTQEKASFNVLESYIQGDTRVTTIRWYREERLKAGIEVYKILGWKNKNRVYSY